MQPEPIVYLMGARRELLKILANNEIVHSTSKIAVEKIAELLAQLAVHQAPLPAILHSLMSEQAAILIDAENLLQDAGRLEFAEFAPPGLGASETEAPGIREDFERQGWALARCCRALASVPNPTASFIKRRDALFQAAMRIEGEARARFCQSLDERKAVESGRRQTSDEITRASPSAEVLTSYLRQRFPQSPAIRVENVRQLVAINSKDLIFFDVEGIEGWPRSVVMRRLREFSFNDQASMAYEFGLLRALADAGIPGPRPLLLDETGGSFGESFLIMERVGGAAETAAALGPRGAAVTNDMAKLLARIHRLDPKISPRYAEQSLPPAERMLRHMRRFHDLWRANQVEPSVTVESGFDWVQRNVGVLGEATALVHGDFDLRNVLVEDGRVSAVLDWERSHIGHPAEDLAYCRKDIEDCGSWDGFMEMYLQNGGFPVTDEMMRFCQICGCLFRVAAGSQVLNGYAGGLHSDFLIASYGYTHFPANIDLLRDLLKQ